MEPNRIRKSIGAETSFAQDLSDARSAMPPAYRSSILVELEQIAQTLFQRIDRQQANGVD